MSSRILGVLARLRRFLRRLRPRTRVMPVQTEGDVWLGGSPFSSTISTINSVDWSLKESFMVPWLSYEEEWYFLHRSDHIEYCRVCRRPLRVAVRVHEDSGRECHPVDLHVEDYVDRPNLSGGGVVLVNEAYKKFSNPDPTARSGISYTVVTSEGSGVPLSGNRFLNELRPIARSGKDRRNTDNSNPFGRKDMVGNFLVVKCDSRICQFLSFRDLLKIAACSHMFAMVVDNELCRRLRLVSQRFIPKGRIQTFFRMLRTSRGAVGSYAALDFFLFVEATDNTLDYNTFEFIVSSTTDSFENVVGFFRRCGYWGFRQEGEVCSDAQDPQNRLLRRLCGFKMTRTGEVLSVVVSESRGSLFAYVLQQPATHLTNIVTFDGIYSFYPELTLSRQALVDFDIDPGDLVQGYRSNQHWGNLSKGKGKKTFLPSLLEMQPLVWASPLACTNQNCKRKINSGPW
ncbi:hypothetical protein BKA70DRAFT_1239336 [Coprinopsis sp. MPI-PUGE-AT-0042]|nr:hypothetical protein BKA70DRAFT_1239336 [Coprinopsis sp. MPI-PUGE-AT-0042]